ncbi:MAG: beta-lactamase family protein [Sphingopyxis sp.]|uniref:serine hydrolase domain-containing protein n=1 Tax=Sphingopyxis sp. TaxID=1908224 RepID=UPI001A1FC069|nr:serine hydrolase domain-containing protein [Sphingopyxis sp.]MBJ7498603.1 beta-lactamase family protein [Sphingopyxis sp.]
MIRKTGETMNTSIATEESSTAITIDGLPDRIDAVIDMAIAEQRLVGAVVLLSLDGKLVYRRAAGLADREANREMREDTLFRLASVSKLYVSTAAMVLVAQGRLALDEPVDTWLADFRPKLADGSSARITLRHLLSHTSGLGYGFLEPADGPYHRAGVSDGMDLSDISLEENIRRIASVPLLFQPGTAWTYSLATDVVGGLIARVTGVPLPEAVRELVATPLGINDTGFEVVDPARLAVPYVNEASGPRRMADSEIVPLWEEVEGLRLSPARALDASAFPSGGAGMIGTAGDTLRILEILRRGGAPLLPTELVGEMATDHAAGMDLAPWPGRGFGLGFTILRDPFAAGFAETPGTWRMGGAYGHSWSVDREKGLSVVAFTNAGLEGQSPGGRFPDELAQAIYA